MGPGRLTDHGNDLPNEGDNNEDENIHSNNDEEEGDDVRRDEDVENVTQSESNNDGSDRVNSPIGDIGMMNAMVKLFDPINISYIEEDVLLYDNPVVNNNTSQQSTTPQQGGPTIVTQESGILDYRHFNEYRFTDLDYQSEFRMLSQQLHGDTETDPSKHLSPKEIDILREFGISSLKPKYPQCSIKSSRVLSFKGFPQRQQTPDSLAEAGFFYSGKDDLVYCFYCGQGLHQWEPNDDPWIEHAKFSPYCTHVRNIKGENFCHMVQDALAHETMNTKNNDTRHTESSSDAVVTTNSKILDAKQLIDSIAAQSVLEFGYSIEIVLQALNVLIKRTKEGETSYNAANILDIILKLEDGIINYKEIFPDPELESKEATSMKTNPLDGSETNTNSKVNGETSNSQKEDLNTMICKICLDDLANIAFLPCGHLVCCGQCSPALRCCPMCRQFIKGTVKVYIP